MIISKQKSLIRIHKKLQEFANLILATRGIIKQSSAPLI